MLDCYAGKNMRVLIEIYPLFYDNEGFPAYLGVDCSHVFPYNTKKKQLYSREKKYKNYNRADSR